MSSGKKQTIFYLSFKLVEFYIEKDVITLGTFYAVIDVPFSYVIE